MKKNRFDLPLTILGWFPCVVVFLMIPTTMYVSNQQDFHFNTLILAPYFSLLAAGFFLLLAAYYLWPALCEKTFPVLFYAGLFLMASDLIAPLQVGEVMVGWDAAPIAEPTVSSVLEACLALGILVAGLRIPRAYLRKYASPTVMFLVAVQIVFSFSQIDFSSLRVGKNAALSSGEYAPEQLTDKPNVYHITFDGFSGYRFMDLLMGVSSAEEFDGFYFFPRNKANYLFTWISRASYMSGTIYREGSLEAWMGRWKTNGLFSEMEREDYVITEYYDSKAEGVSFSRQGAFGYEHIGMSMIEHVHFADLWILRIVPTMLRQEVFRANSNAGVATFFARRFFLASTLDALPIKYKADMELLIAEEEQRPGRGQFVWAHLYIPHGPFNLNQRCEYQVDAGYAGQARCTIRLMATLLDVLKRQNKYHSSMIVFHSDHGSIGVDRSEMSADIARRISAGSASGRYAQEVLNLSSSLLLVKPPFSSGDPLKVSGKLTQLADIPATIYGMAGIDHGRIEGVNVFGDSFDEKRSIDIFSGYVRKGEDGGTVRFGKGIDSGHFDNYGYSLPAGWEIREMLPVTW